jgi:fatty acid desaturase
MGTILLILFVLLLLMCFCIYNWWFLKEKNKRIPMAQRGNQPFLNSHTAWGAAALILLLAILGIMGIELYQLVVNIMNMRN